MNMQVKSFCPNELKLDLETARRKIMRYRSWLNAWLGIWSTGAVLALCACSAETIESSEEVENPPEESLGEASEALVDCTASTDTGYTRGQAFTITVVHVDGKPVEVETAKHYIAMQDAAAASGVALRISSGFRTMAKQQYLYRCYTRGTSCNSCNNCNRAAKPGYSNHQSGQALDLNSKGPGVMAWLNAHAAEYGFARTVADEEWHWEWLGGGKSVEACGGPVGADGCTPTERANASKFGCACVNHQGEGGMCPGDGCTATEQQNASKFGCSCVEHQGAGGMCPGDGCTQLERQNALKFGCFCVDHQGAGGACPGTGCTAKETNECAAYGKECNGHECI
jgi:hypothetical protein